MRLAPPSRCLFASVAVQRRHADGSALVRERDRDGPVLLLLEGRADVLTHAPDGTAVIYEQAGPGSLLGALEAIDGRPRPHGALARGGGRSAVASAAAFRRLLDQPAFARDVSLSLADTVRRLSDRVFEFGTMPVRDRLMSELLRCVDAADGGEGPVRLCRAPTQSDLAARIATHREAVSREMGRLGRLGLVVRQGRDLIVPSRGALARHRDSAAAGMEP